MVDCRSCRAEGTINGQQDAAGVDPTSITFVTGAHGEPYVVGLPVDLRLNLSHAGERALIALTVGREVGIDIEEPEVAIRPRRAGRRSRSCTSIAEGS